MVRRRLPCPPELNYTEEEWNSFDRNKRWALRNPGRMAELSRDWNRKNPDRRVVLNRGSRLRNIYGITQDDYDRMLEAQGGRCAICKTATPTGKWKVFAVDHCHTTGKIRGLLCNECNRGMGLLRDSAELLRKAADYLDQHNKKTQEERNGKS